MLTRCPRCLTVFRLLAEHLKMAHGQVQCGRCHLQFDAIENLQDESLYKDVLAADTSQREEARPTSFPSASQPSSEQVTEPPAPLEMPEWAYDDLPPDDFDDEPSIGADLAVTEVDSHRVSSNEGDKQEASVALRDFDADIESLKLQNDAASKSSVKAEDILLSELPRVPIEREEIDALRSYLAEGAGSRPKDSPWWGMVAAMLLVALLAQFIWYEREWIFKQLPQAREWWQQLCSGKACALPPRRDLDALHVIARDVRDHPQYRDALLVNATVVNEADFSQPYPVLELALFDQSGHPLGVRRFEPREYLDDSIAIEAGMKPHQPVYIVLELVGIGDQAVSFEFKFL